MLTPEGKVKAAVKKVLKAARVYFFMPVQNGMGRVGIPDFICCVNGRFVAIETKAPGKSGTLTPNQQREIGLIRGANGDALVVESAEEVQKFLVQSGAYASPTEGQYSCLNRQNGSCSIRRSTTRGRRMSIAASSITPHGGKRYARVERM
jgi:hypothetical protein